MHAVNLIAQALPETEAPSPQPIGTGICCVTGLEGPVVRRKDLLGPSFTDGALLAAPQSEWASIDAYRALRYKWERMSSWVCDGDQFWRLDRQGVRKAVLHNDLPLRPWCGYATTSYKKHGAVRAPINSGERAVWLFESRLVDCSDRFKLFDWWIELNRALRLFHDRLSHCSPKLKHLLFLWSKQHLNKKGFCRHILEAIDCPPFFIEEIGVAEWMAFETWAQPKQQSALYAFLCYLLPSQEELKHELQAAD